MKNKREFKFKEYLNNKEEVVFWGLFLLMAVYYGYRLFALTPWYDELYTYYCFISKGPVYAAIHWPLPNNHVGYSVLSACLDLFGNSYIGLRGVSYLAALANLRFIYVIAHRYMKGWLPIGTLILYLSMNLVNQMTVQGRGYTLGITCFLVAFYCMSLICEEEKPTKLVYISYIMAIVIGLYAVSSNVYWVVPLCLTGGIYLLIHGIKEPAKRKRLIQLILASVVAAILTIGLYAIIWVAIGSNLLVKDNSSIYYGMSHVNMILKAPFDAIKRGMEYMLDTPYIQSEDRAGFLGRLGGFFISLFGYYYNEIGVFVLGVTLVGMILVIYRVIKWKKTEYQASRLLELLLLVQMIFIPICLLIQCKRPYFRVFTYGGVLVALMIGVLLQIVWTQLKKSIKNQKILKVIPIIVGIMICAFGIKCIAFSGYNGQYSVQEYEIEDAFKHGNVTDKQQICVTDCNQEYLLYFLYGIRCENKQIEDSELVLLDKRMTDPDFKEMIWEFYHYYDTIPWDYIEQNMKPIYENNGYILYEASK